ncbi:hypothetical protein [Vibrio anguillarum]|nr:hypothetical protein [Vibrio anguillarum]ATC60280.1 hypothetical protein CMV05_23100 [Vibrio anguillarum]MBF4249505.1 hypothetical protein [Vibrio anguillarum]MBF4340721.1 hypothetical protein [Vibrio anguillarum]
MIFEALPTAKAHKVIQWTGDNLKEVLEFTGKSEHFDEWFSSFEEYESFVKEHGYTFKLFGDRSTQVAHVGDYITKSFDRKRVWSQDEFSKHFVLSEMEESQLMGECEVHDSPKMQKLEEGIKSMENDDLNTLTPSTEAESPEYEAGPKYSKLTEDDITGIKENFSGCSREDVLQHLISLIDDKKVLESKISDWWEASNSISLSWHLNVDYNLNYMNIVDTLDVLINAARNAEEVLSVDTMAMSWLSHKYPLALAQMIIARRKFKTIDNDGLYVFTNYFTESLSKLKRDPNRREQHVIEEKEMWEDYVETYDYWKGQPKFVELKENKGEEL